MKKIFFSLVLLCCCLAVQAGGRIGKLRSVLKDSRSDYVFVVSHRGDWRHSPENSVSAIEGAAAMGVDMVEIDIQKTKDGNFVLMHDGNIDRMTDGKGNVSDYTAEELKKFRLRNPDGSLSDETIPTLKEAFLACKGKLLVNIDKGGDYLSEIESVIRETGMEDHVVLKGRNGVQDVTRRLAGYKDIVYMPITDLDGDGAIPYIASFLSDFHPAAMEVIFKADGFAKLDYLQVIRASGCRIWINSLWASLCGGHEDEKAMIDPDVNWGWILEQGASIVQTDRPQELIRYLKGKGRRNLR